MNSILNKFTLTSFNRIIISLNIFMILMLGSCKHEDYNFPIAPINIEDLIPINVVPVTDIPQRSNNDYNLNENGLITENTLQRWWSDWRNNKPTGIPGKLVLIHSAIGTATNDYVIPKESEEIYSYSLPNAMQVLGEVRSNGVLESVDMNATGGRFEQILARFGINPTRDLVVFIPDGNGVNSAFWMALRGWYTFRYWGVDARNLAVLNGGVSAVLPSSMRSSRLSSEGLGTDYSIARRKIDNTILQATLQDVMRYVDGRDSYPTGVYIVDARSVAEYGAIRTGTWPNDALKATPSARSTSSMPEVIPFEGHIRGADNLPFGELLDITTGSGSTAGRRFKNLSEIETIFGSRSNYGRGKLIVPYCRTNVRSMVTGFANVAIIGNPTRFYDGSWIEWGSLSGRQGTGIISNLRANSPWRTDTETYTSKLSYNVPSGSLLPNDLPAGIVAENLPNATPSIQVEQRTLTNFEIFNRDTLKSLNEDKDFIRGIGGGGGGSRPARPGNPCG